MFVGFLGRGARNSQELIALGAATTAVRFADIRGYRSRSVANLVTIDESLTRIGV